MGCAHSFSTPACNRFNDDRISNFFGYRESFFFVIYRTVTARNNGDFCFDCHLSGFCFVTKIDNRILARTNELNLTLCALLSKFSILRKKAISRVDRIYIRNFGCCNDSVGLKVALITSCWSDANCLVGELHMEGLLVSLRVDS